LLDLNITYSIQFINGDLSKTITLSKNRSFSYHYQTSLALPLFMEVSVRSHVCGYVYVLG